MMKGTSEESSKSVMDGETANNGQTSGVITKKAKRISYEKQLEEVVKDLQQSKAARPGSGTTVTTPTPAASLASGASTNDKGVKKQKLRPEQEMLLLEQKCILLLKLKRYKEVVDDGYSILGRMGPNPTIYKCILIALVRLRKPEDDLQELLEVWKKATPKCPHLIEAKRKFDGYIAALRSGVKHCDIFSGIEDALALNAESILSKQLNDAIAVEEKKWRFRAPPPRHTTFAMCPRSSPANSCIYGDECLFAHSAEELKEWKMRVEIDKKNNNLSDDLASGENRVVKKKMCCPPIYKTLLIPPLCINYLLDLGKKIKEAVDIKEILLDEIPGVKLKVDTPLNFRKRIDGMNNVQCTWSFVVGSKMPMGTVSILHDANRDSFRISTGLYYNKKKESISLIELHPNNKIQTKLQVLNTFIAPQIFLRFNSGWPDICCYKVDVTFESRDPFPEPGLYRQSIVFDFKKDPKIVKHISIEVLPKVEPIGNHLTEAAPAPAPVTKSPWAVPTPPPAAVQRFVESTETLGTFSLGGETLNSYPNFNREVLDADSRPNSVDFLSKPSDFPSLTPYVSESVSRYTPTKEPELFDSESGKVLKLKGLPLSALEEKELVGRSNLFLEDVPLTRDNYGTWMRDFLDVELLSRQKVVNRLKKTMDVKISHQYLDNPDYVYKFPSSELYGRIEIMSEISCDLKLERLINSSVVSAIISVSDTPTRCTRKRSFKRFLCTVVSKSKSTLCIAMGAKARDDLRLVGDSIEKLQVQFVLDAAYIANTKLTLESLTNHHLEILFPDFQNSKLPFLRAMDPMGLLDEEELLLNSKQLGVYNLVLGRKVLIDETDFTPPVIVTGGVSTGKTYLLAHCIKGVIRAQRALQDPVRILVCTQSDLAADTFITDYLHRWLINDELSVQRSKPLRVYDKARYVDNVSGAVKHYCLFDEQGICFRYPTKEEVMSHKIIITTFSTCSELVKLGLEEDTFSHIIIDEATNCLEAECVIPILLSGQSSRIVLAGDVMQSDTNIYSISKGVPPISLLERLRNAYPFRHPFVVNLVENYVNHDVITRFISKEFYHDQLRAVVNHPDHPVYYPLTFYHIPTSHESHPDSGGGSYNLEEIKHIVDFVHDLYESWPESWGPIDSKQSVVVLTPYVNHINCLRVQLQVRGLQLVNVELASHVPSRKYRVVIISTVRTFRESISDSDEAPVCGGFFSDRRLLISAISAAKSLVAAFGDALSLWDHGICQDIWRKFLNECQLHKSLIDVRAQPQPAPQRPPPSILTKVENEDPVVETDDFSSSTARARETLSALNLNGFQPTPIGPPSRRTVSDTETSASYYDQTSRSRQSQSSSHSVSSEDEILSTPRRPAFATTMSCSFRPLQSGSQLPLPTPIGQMPPAGRCSATTTKNVDNSWNLGLDDSWNVSPAFGEAPKTDLFSAFSTNETLYSSKSPPTTTFKQEVKNPPNTLSSSSSNLTLSEAIASFTGLSPRAKETVIEPTNFNLPSQVEEKCSCTDQTGPRPLLAPSPLRASSQMFNLSINQTAEPLPFPAPTPVRTPSQMFNSPIDFPALVPTTVTPPVAKIHGSFSSAMSKSMKETKSDDFLDIIPNEQMPLPEPTIPSRMLFDQKFLSGSSSEPFSKPFEAASHHHSQSQVDPGNNGDSENAMKYPPPLMRIPPGFAPISPSVESILGTFSSSSVDDKYSFPGSPLRTVTSNGGIAAKHSYKKSVYELPPRMLKNLQLASTRSPLKKKLTPKPQPVEMNFFEELGLNSPLPTEGSRSLSSASSDHSFLDLEDSNSVAEDEEAEAEPTTSSNNNDEWIEVKSSRKGRNQNSKRKGKAKRVSSFEGHQDVKSVSGQSSEMSVDDKVEIITQMGFHKSQAIKALQACEKDLQRAVDWLISKPTSNKSSI